MILAPLGCSLLLGEGFSDPQPAEAGQADPAVLDATTELDDGAKDIATTSDVDAADAGADPNMLVNPDFETPDCAGWYSEYAAPAEIAVPRSGVRGCLVCGVAGNVQAQFYQPVPVAVAPGAAFLGELWVRAAPDEVAPVATELGLEVDIRGPLANKPIQFGTANYGTKPLASEWVRLNATITSTTDAGTAVQLFLHFPAGTRTCVVVDSARLVKTVE